MSGHVGVVLDGVAVTVPAGITVAAALLNDGARRFRSDLEGAARAPLCGMGSCMECRVVIDGRAEQRACLVLVVEGMRVETTR